MRANKNYLFDVDGTLTEHRRKMSATFMNLFLDWAEKKSVFLVAGSNLEKVDEQVPPEVIGVCDGVFCSMANQLWSGRNNLVYENEWTPDPHLVESLIAFQMYTKFPIRPKRGGRGEIIERRTGMINFTTIGRNADMEERERYYEWDKKTGERKNIVEQLQESFSDLDFRIGGQISIDIQPKGINKSQASKWVRENLGGEIVYFGDKCHVGGNDYDICLDVRENGGVVHEVECPDDTLSILISDEN